MSSTITVNLVNEDKDILDVKGLGYMLGDEWHFWWDKKEDEVLPSKVYLSEKFFKSIQNTASPIDFDSFMELTATGGALASDVYAWILVRIFNIKKPVRISFSQLHEQFGSEYSRERAFKPKLAQAIKKIKSFHPELKLEISDSSSPMGFRGIVLFPSKKQIKNSTNKEISNIK